MEIEKIRYYISYFETVHAETACRWEGSQKLKNGAFSMPFPVYETQFLDFIDDISMFSYSGSPKLLLPHSYQIV